MRNFSLLGQWLDPSRALAKMWAKWLSMATLLLLSGVASSAAAAPSLRFQTDVRGDLLLIGNTLGFDCRAGIPDPKVGSFDRKQCYQQPSFNQPLYIDDRSADVFWRAEDTGQISADSSITVTQARSAAVLQLPAGAIVAYARIYWGSTVREDTTNASSIFIDRPGAGGFSQMVQAATSDLQAADNSFQATADITSLVQASGAGLYRVSGANGFPKAQLVDRQDPNNYAAWSIVIIYKLDSAPIRTFSIYDGLTYVSPGSNSSLMLQGFVVPPQGAIDSKLAIIGYKGDHDQVGDAVLLKGNHLTDGQPGSDTNFFNSSHTLYGQPVSTVGDLPQLTGDQGSMSGVDLDVVNITSQLAANDVQAKLDFVTGTTIDTDRYFIGAVVSAIVSHKPLIETTLTVPAGTNPLPGDVVEYTSSSRNVGDDDATGVVISHLLPPGLSYVPGSIRIVSGTTQTPLTDQAGDDQADFDSASGTLRIRIGTGADATNGGTLQQNGTPIVVKYLLQIADSASGAVATQSFSSATPSSQPTTGVTTYPSSDGTMPNHPTVVTVRACATNYDCTLTAPVCNMQATPHSCTASCMSSADCLGAPGGQEVCGPSMRCAQCSTTQTAACTPSGLGGACLPSGACGCMSDTDCGGRTCNLTSHSCPNPSADLAVALRGDSTTSPITVHITVSNKGPALAPSGTQLLITLPAGATAQQVQTTGGWRCSAATSGLLCKYNRPLSPGSDAPDVQLAVVTQGGSQSGSPLTIQATVSSSVVNDPDPSNNSASLDLSLSSYRITGGGLGCSLARGDNSASLLGALATMLALLFLARRRSALPSRGTSRAGNV